MVLVHHDRDVREFFNCGQNQMAQEWGTCVFACACGCLNDNGGVDLVGRLHNGAHLFEVVNVECGQTVAVFGSMVQQLAHGYECHEKLLK